MVTAIIPKKEETLSVKEIGDILAEPLRVCGATVSYLGGEYVRTDRTGDIRVGDKLTLVVIAEELFDKLGLQYWRGYIPKWHESI